MLVNCPMNLAIFKEVIVVSEEMETFQMLRDGIAMLSNNSEMRRQKNLYFLSEQFLEAAEDGDWDTVVKQSLLLQAAGKKRMVEFCDLQLSLATDGNLIEFDMDPVATLLRLVDSLQERFEARAGAKDSSSIAF